MAPEQVLAVTTLRPGTRVDVRCHVNCPWREGFELVAIEVHGSTPHYRVRAADHDRPLPALFPPAHVRLAEDPRHGGASGGRWGARRG